ncbi:macro domain-containing protein [Endozoicomonas sp. YOMI1]|uniref:macro domain-containing protein n=1 Tax=Endozoicomonas sp. YOMI1 TaxID=2828739 RepID=UPI00214910C4|nr:macro domain-containing protein [Endozoicomonas sp. YOMI1]
MDGAIRTFCDQVSDKGALRLQECGINKKNQFVCGRTVDSIDNGRLLRELTKYPALEHIVGKSVVTKYELPVHYHYLAPGIEKTLPGGVTLVTCNQGLLTWAGRKNGIKPYGIVNSVDQRMELNRGIGEAIKNKFGGTGCDYHNISRQHQINYGECFTYNCTREGKPSDLGNCQKVYNVLVPVAGDHSFFASKLKKTFLEIFKAADFNGLPRIFCPLLGCGRAGGSGKALAEAVSAAKADFESTGKQAPELILVGMSSSGTDKAACIDFENHWPMFGQQTPSTRPPTYFSSTVPSTGASASLSVARTETPLPGRVTLVTCNDGLLTWVGRKNDIKPYGIVSSVDQLMQLDSGIAQVIKGKFRGTDYHKMSWQHQINYGECFTYDCAREGRPSDLNNCQTIHNVLVPFSSDRDFAEKLKNAFLEVFNAADGKGLDRIFCPLLGCGRASGSGVALAEAVSAAKADFESTGRQAPELILVGRSSEAGDIKACEDFASQWKASVQRTPSTGLPVRSVKMPAAISRSGAAATVTAINATTSTGSGYNTPTVLIPDQLEIVMNSDNGMFGYAKDLSKQGIPFDLVNAANSKMNHSGGIARQFSDDLGAAFNQSTRRHVPVGGCYTTGPFGYASDPRFGLSHCQHIHNVVAPNKADYKASVNSSYAGMKTRLELKQKYHKDFTNAFVSLLLEGSYKGSNTIVSCFIGCAIFGGSGEDMARALHAAYQDPRIQKLAKVPKLILVGWRDADWTVQGSFIQEFNSLNTSNPVRLPSGITPVSAPPAGISGTVLPVGTGTTPNKTSPYFRSGAARSGAAMSSGSRPRSPVSTPADSPIPVDAARRFIHPGGVLGFAWKYYGNIMPFSLVNAVHKSSDVLNTEVASNAGVQAGYRKHMIMDGGEHALRSKKYYQCEAWDYKHTDGYQGCQKIHSVLFPKITDRSGFSQQLVTLLIKAAPGERLLFPLYELEGVTDSAFKDVLKRVYSDPQVLRMAGQDKLPKLYFVHKARTSSMSGDAFAQTTTGSDRSHPKSSYSLSQALDLTRLGVKPEPEATSAKTSSRNTWRDSTGVSKSGESATTAFSGSEKAFVCGVCNESKPEKGSQQHQGVKVCSGCTEYYREQGLDLSVKLAEEYAAINYQPLKVFRSDLNLPEYPGAGRIVVGIDATAPARLSDGRMLDVTRKTETHYLPDNDVGNELLRLLQVLHEEKLIYKIDKSNTTGKFGITFNFHLKTSDSGGVPNHGYPDKDYPERAASEIAGLGATHSLGDRLDVSELLRLISIGSSKRLLPASGS